MNDTFDEDFTLAMQSASKSIKENAELYESIVITEEIHAAIELFLDYPSDWDMFGKPITRRSAGWPCDTISFAAGVQYARSLK